jgi:hypothetical protein
MATVFRVCGDTSAASKEEMAARRLRSQHHEPTMSVPVLIRRVFFYILSVSLWMSVLDSRSVAGSVDELEAVREGHRATVSLIRTFSCNVEIAGTSSGKPFHYTGHYSRAGHLLRATTKSEKGLQNVLVRDGITSSFSDEPHPERGRVTGGSITTKNVPIKCDPWSFGLLTFYGADHYRVTFDDLLAQPHTLHAVRKISEGGHPLIYVDLSHKRARHEIWFDPQKNYLVSKLRSHLLDVPTMKSCDESTVVSYSEPTPGIFFPERVDSRSIEGRKADRSVIFTDIVINQPLPPEAFDFHFPPGIVVADQIEGKMRQTDSDGRPILPVVDSSGRERPLATIGPIASSADSPEPVRLPTRVEPRPWTDWLFYVSALAVACLGIVWIGRKTRSMLARTRSA